MAGAGRGIQAWMDMLQEATVSCARDMFCVEECPVEYSGAGPAEAGPGAYITLVGKSESVQMGIISSTEGCKLLAGMLLGMEADECDDMSGADMVDAYGEILNVVAGVVKQLVNESDSSFHLGLPIFINGQVCAMEHQESMVNTLSIGGVSTHLLVLTPGSSES